eukprot:6486395-Amphidinium_carterae.2
MHTESYEGGKGRLPWHLAWQNPKDVRCEVVARRTLDSDWRKAVSVECRKRGECESHSGYGATPNCPKCNKGEGKIVADNRLNRNSNRNDHRYSNRCPSENWYNRQEYHSKSYSRSPVDTWCGGCD